MRSNWMLVLLLLFVANAQAADSAVDLAKIERTIAKEPKYAHEPRYSLLVFGLQAQHRSWLVMDGSEVLYLDRNGNGDLTDPEDRLEYDSKATRAINLGEDSSLTSMNVFELGTVAGVKLRFQFWVRSPSYVPKEEILKEFYRERAANKWENGSLYRLTDKMGAQNPILLTATPAEARIHHLNGPLTFALKWDTRQRLQPWPRQTVFDINIGTPGLRARNSTHSVFSPLTEEEILCDIHPVAVFEFPPAKPGDKPVTQTIELDQRCCGDTAYAQLSLPKDIGSGPAKVTLSFPAWKVRDVSPATFEVPIGTDGPVGEEVSYVMFDDPGSKITLNEILTTLRMQRFKVQKVALEGKPEALQVRLKDGAILVITLNREAKVADDSKSLGAGTAFEKMLSRSQSRFEVLIYPGTLVTEEQELLARIHTALQAETHGVLYTAWNQKLSAEK